MNTPEEAQRWEQGCLVVEKDGRFLKITSVIGRKGSFPSSDPLDPSVTHFARTALDRAREFAANNDGKVFALTYSGNWDPVGHDWVNPRLVKLEPVKPASHDVAGRPLVTGIRWFRWH